MTDAIPLPARLDLVAVKPLAAQIEARAGEPLVFDAALVEVVGGLGLQLLLAAQQSCARAGLPMSIAPRSPAFDHALAGFGIGIGALQNEVMK